MKKLFLLIFCVAMATMMLAQTQKGYVKTKGRLGTDGQLIPGEPLGEVTVKVKDRNVVMSDKRGDFSFPMPDETYYLESVTKSGYVMIDPEMLSKQYSYSKNKLVIALETRENQLEERMDMNEKIMRAQRELIDKLRAEVKQLKADNKITEEEYYKRLQEIVDMQNENRQLVEDLVDHYSKIDYDDMNEFDRLFSSYLLNGDLRKADSLVNSKGDLTKRADEYYQLREANAKAREDLETRKKKLEKSEAAEKKSRDELANLYYKKFEINKMKHQNDSAAYWLEERVKLDTTNVEWIKEVAYYYSHYIADYDRALQYYELSVGQAILQFGDNNYQLANIYKKIGFVYDNLDNTDSALLYYNMALDIYDNENEEVISVYNAIAQVYSKLDDLNKAIEYNNKALSLCIQLYGEENEYAAYIYDVFGSIYTSLGEYEEAVNYINKAIWIKTKLFGENDDSLAVSYNNLSIAYLYLKDITKALDYCTMALTINLKVYGEKHPHVANLYNILGSIYSKRGDLEKSLEYYNKALSIHMELFGIMRSQVGTLYNNAGLVYCKLKNFDKSLEYHNKALMIFTTLFGENCDGAASSYYDIGYNMCEMGEFEQSIIYLEKSLLIWKSVFGNNHPYVIRNYDTLAHVYLEMENYEKALQEYNQEYSIIENLYGQNDKRTMRIISKISEVESKLAESKKK